MQTDCPADEPALIDGGDAPPRPLPFSEALVVWCRVALLSFGGPAGQIAVMHRILVEEKRWISEERFLHALNYCMLLPGPEAQQLSVYVGWLLNRTLGGLVAGCLFILPGFISILVLSIVYAYFQQAMWLQAVFLGLKCAVLAIVIDAVVRIGKRVLTNFSMVSVAVASFVAIFFLNVPFPILIVVAAIVGFVGHRLAPGRFVAAGHAGGRATGATSETAPITLHQVPPTLRRALLVSALGLGLWLGPVLAMGAMLGRSSIYVQEGEFFSKAAVVTFGGAYSVLAYIGQQAVENYGWLEPREMLDGLGMAETTPGPLIQVVQFVGFLGAYRSGEGLTPLWAGICGALITTWVTFAPCFLWIFLGAPYIEQLRGNRLLAAALSTVTAAVVGVVLNLAIWFALHTLFAQVATDYAWGMRLLIPDWATVHVAAVVITLLALWLTFYAKRGIAVTLAVCTAAGVLLYAL